MIYLGFLIWIRRNPRPEDLCSNPEERIWEDILGFLMAFNIWDRGICKPEDIHNSQIGYIGKEKSDFFEENLYLMDIARSSLPLGFSLNM